METADASFLHVASTWLTTGEAAELLGLTHRAVVYRITAGHLRAVKRAGVYLIDPASVQAEVGRKRFERRTAS